MLQPAQFLLKRGDLCALCLVAMLHNFDDVGEVLNKILHHLNFVVYGAFDAAVLPRSEAWRGRCHDGNILGITTSADIATVGRPLFWHVGSAKSTGRGT